MNGHSTRRILLSFAKALVPALVLLSQAAATNATVPEQHRLFSVSEWNRACSRFGPPEKVSFCKEQLHLAVTNGRSLGPYEVVDPADQSLLKSRSGVLFHPDLNEMVVRVKEDTGLRTTLRLQDNVQCQTYTTIRGLVGMPSETRGHHSLVNSWLHTYTDASFQVHRVDIHRQNDRQTLKFNAVTANNSVIRGAFSIDERTNAAIFSTCEHPATSARARESAELFFSSIVGSARKFL